MSSLIKFIDVFGTKFTFTMKQKESFKTVPGGIFTIISFAIFLVLFFFLGKDFISKENPKVFISVNRTDTPEFMMPFDYNLTIAYKIEFKKKNTNPEYLNTDNFTYTTILNKNNTHGNIVQHVKCKDLPYNTSYSFDESLNCLNFNPGDKLGGIKMFNEYFTNLHFSTCKEALAYNATDEACMNIRELFDLIKLLQTDLAYYMTVYYPVLDYDPRNRDTPAQIRYDNYKFFFDYNIQREDFLYLQKNIIREDIGWLFEDFRETIYYTIGERDHSYSFLSDEALLNAYDEIYRMRIDLNDKIIIYTRSYTKFQELLAVVMTLINLLMFIFVRLSSFFSNALFTNSICNQLFDWAPYKYSSLLPNNAGGSGLGTAGGANANNDNLSRSIFARSQNQVIPSSLGLDISKINISNIYVKPKKIRSWFVIKRAFGKCALSNSEKLLAEHYDEAIDITREKLDLVNYVNMIYDLIAIKRTIMLKDGQQPNLFNEVKKVSIYDKKELNLVFYYNRMSKEQTIISNIDKSQSMQPANKQSIINPA